MFSNCCLSSLVSFFLFLLIFICEYGQFLSIHSPFKNFEQIIESVEGCRKGQSTPFEHRPFKKNLHTGSKDGSCKYLHDSFLSHLPYLRKYLQLIISIIKVFLPNFFCSIRGDGTSGDSTTSGGGRNIVYRFSFK